MIIKRLSNFKRQKVKRIIWMKKLNGSLLKALLECRRKKEPSRKGERRKQEEREVVASFM